MVSLMSKITMMMTNTGNVPFFLKLELSTNPALIACNLDSYASIASYICKKKNVFKLISASLGMRTCTYLKNEIHFEENLNALRA